MPNLATLAGRTAARNATSGVLVPVVRRRNTDGVSPALDTPGCVEDARRTSPGATALFSLPDGADGSETRSSYFTDRPLDASSRWPASARPRWMTPLLRSEARQRHEVRH